MNVLSLLSLSFVASVLAHPTLQSRSSFSSLVAFGDELSDTGTGSFAHGMTGGTSVYGFNTWTNGPTLPMHLSQSLGLPLTSYAFGGCCGGASAGATLSNSYTPADAGAPDLFGQISNYTSMSSAGQAPAPQTALGVVWIGQNDLSHHTDAFWQDDPHNAAFATDFTSYHVSAVQKLLTLGLSRVLVIGLYPKHLAPVTAKYLCGSPSNACVTTWGNIIAAANTQLKTTLRQKFGTKVIYYDSASYISALMANAAANGFTAPTTSFCDGMDDATWNQCIQTDATGKVVGWDVFFWMNFIQPNTRVVKMMAADVSAKLKSSGLSF